MKHPNIRTKVVHSQSKSAWNVVGDDLGSKFKIARVPYYSCDNEQITTRNKAEALEHAQFISYVFNNRDRVNL